MLPLSSAYILLLMIIRANRSQSRLKGDEHRKFQTLIEQLQRQNKQLRLQLLRIEQRLLQSQLAKKKYKGKYRQTKQKLEILTLVKIRQNSSNDPYDLCMSPKTKTTRIKTISEEEFNSIRAGMNSDFDEQIETKVQIDHYQTHHSYKRGTTAPSTMKQIEQEKERDLNDERIFENLMKLHEQLEKLSHQIEQSPNIEQRIVACENQLYQKLQEVVEKVNKMELRDVERENRRLSHEKEKVARKFNGSMKTIQHIGRDLLDFKVDQ